MHYATTWEAIADRIGSETALVHGERRISWRSFDDHAARLAGAFRARGLGHGDGVAAYLYNCPECFEVFFGALKIRAVPSNVNYRYGNDELLALLENSGAKALVFDAALADRVASLAGRAGDLLLVQVGGQPGSTPAGALAYEDLLASAEPAERIDRDPEDVFLSYTGGTTGLPKGVLFRIGQSAGNSLWFRDLFMQQTTTLTPAAQAVRLAEARTRLVAIPASPLMHSTGFILASLPTLTAGGQVETLPSRSFDAHQLLRAVESSEATIVAIVGDAFALPMVRALDEGGPDGRPYRTETLRVIVSAGVAWSAQVKTRLLEHMPEVTLFDSCGSTEGLAYGISQVRRGDPVSTANFNAAPGLMVIDPEGRELPRGEVGLLAGPTTASGYHGDPERTASIFWDMDGARVRGARRSGPDGGRRHGDPDRAGGEHHQLRRGEGLSRRSGGGDQDADRGRRLPGRGCSRRAVRAQRRRPGGLPARTATRCGRRQRCRAGHAGRVQGAPTNPLRRGGAPAAERQDRLRNGVGARSVRRGGVAVEAPARRFLHVCYSCGDAASVSAQLVDGLEMRVTMRSPRVRKSGEILGLDRQVVSEADFVYDARGPRTSPAVEVQGWVEPPPTGRPHDDPSAVGLQALGFSVPEIAPVRSRLEAHGCAVIGSGSSPFGTPWTTLRDRTGVALDLVGDQSVPTGESRMRHLRVTVSDLGASVSWYRGLGFEVVGEAVLEDGSFLGWPGRARAELVRLRLPDEPYEAILVPLGHPPLAREALPRAVSCGPVPGGAGGRRHPGIVRFDGGRGLGVRPAPQVRGTLRDPGARYVDLLPERSGRGPDRACRTATIGLPPVILPSR